MPKKNGHIGVVPFGNPPKIALKVIMAHITAYLNLSPVITSPRGLPGDAFDKRRLQYDAAMLIEDLEKMPAAGFQKAIGVTDADIFIPIFTHVYGEARQNGFAAAVSLHRLDGNDGEKRFLERAAKVALHEIGHLFDLTHCSDSKCLMHFSGDLEALDAGPIYYCRYCAGFFQEKAGVMKINQSSAV